MNWAVGWARQRSRGAASASYVTGAHNMKFGYNGGHLVDNFENFTNSQNLLYRVNNGVPNRHHPDDAAVQDACRRSTSPRSTPRSSGRRDGRRCRARCATSTSWSHFPAQTIGPHELPADSDRRSSDRWASAATTTSCRAAGVASTCSAIGTTSLKVNVGQYVDPASNTSGNYSLANPVARIATTANRRGPTPNGNFVADCDLMNRAAQDLRPVGGDSCGALDNQSFGTATFSNTIDPAIWRLGHPSRDWQIGVSIQREVLPRVSVEVGYDRRWLQNFVVTDNRAVAASDFTPFSITAPTDPRLPGGGGYVVSGLYDVVPERFGVTDNYVTDAKNYGKQYQVYDGLLLNVSARPRNGLTLQGSINAGKTVKDACEVRDNLPELASNSPANVGPVVCPDEPLLPIRSRAS